MNPKIKQNTKAIILGLVVAIGAGYASAWTGPTASPTAGNVPAPINIGDMLQTKSGILNLVHLNVTDLTVATGSPTIGQVLTAVDSTGRVGWGNAAGVAHASNCPTSQFVKGVSATGDLICDYIVPIATITVGADEEALFSIQGKTATMLETTRNGASINAISFADTINGMPTDGRPLKITSLSSYGGTSIVDPCPDKATWGGGTYSLSSKICVYQQPTAGNSYTTKIALWDGASGGHDWTFTLGY